MHQQLCNATMKLSSRLKQALLLFVLAVAATVLIFRAWGDSDGNFVSHARDESRKSKTTVLIASRNLMSQDPVEVSPKLTTAPVVAPSSPLSFKVLLQKSTSRLVCKAKNSASDSLLALNAAATDKYSTKRTGYVLVASFREQQTKASDNLFGLQCWAKTLLVNIVEPFIENSHFVVPMSGDQSNLLRYRDIFDLDVWQLLTAQYRFAPLSSWDSFLSNAPRKLIVVRFKYLSAKMSKKRKSSNESVTHFAVSSSFKEGCDMNNIELSRKIHYLITEHNFTVIRKVCFNFALGDELTLLQFNRHLYEGLRPKTVTVLMEEWRGLGSLDNGKRVVLSNACLPSKYVQSVTYTWPSQQLICDAKKYRQKYLKTANYISLMVRTEKILSLNSSRDFMASCLNETLKSWKELVDKTGMATTFLAMDIGSYGSDSLVEQNGDSKYYPFLDLYEVFLQQLFGPRATIKTWELGFEATAAKRDLGYIGSLQKTLAAQSRCMVLSGGGTFQKHAQHIYDRINHGRRKPCVKVLHKCSRGLL